MANHTTWALWDLFYLVETRSHYIIYQDLYEIEGLRVKVYRISKEEVSDKQEALDEWILTLN